MTDEFAPERDLRGRSFGYSIRGDAAPEGDGGGGARDDGGVVEGLLVAAKQRSPLNARV